MFASRQNRKRPSDYESHIEFPTGGPRSGGGGEPEMHFHFSIDRNAVCTVFAFCTLSAVAYAVYGGHLSVNPQRALILKDEGGRAAQNPTVTVVDKGMMSRWQGGEAGSGTEGVRGRAGGEEKGGMEGGDKGEGEGPTENNREEDRGGSEIVDAERKKVAKEEEMMREEEENGGKSRKYGQGKKEEKEKGKEKGVDKEVDSKMEKEEGEKKKGGEETEEEEKEMSEEEVEKYARIEQDAGEDEGKLKTGEWIPALYSYPPTTGTDEELSKLVDPNKKYMFYNLTNDFCAGLLHYARSQWAMIGEAKYLKRTLVWLPIGLGAHHNRGRFEMKDPGVFFDKKNITSEYVDIISLADFLAGVAYWSKQGKELSRETILYNVDTKDKVNSEAVVLARDYSSVWDHFVFSMVDYVPWPSKEVEYAPQLKQLLEDILKELPDDFDVVHVRRGDKAYRKIEWPNLELDTRPEKLLKKLPKLVKPGRYLYIATNEHKKGFFEPLKSVYKVLQLEDFKFLWAKKSAWWNQTIAAVGSTPPPTFDGYQAGFVDYGIVEHGKVHVETFNDLTDDPWGGYPERRWGGRRRLTGFTP